MVKVLASHSCSSDCWRETRRGQEGSRSCFVHFIAHRRKHKVSAIVEHTANESYLKDVPLHLQSTYYRDGSNSQFGARFGQNSCGNLILSFCGLGNASGKSGDSFIRNGWSVDRRREVIWGRNMKISNCRLSKTGLRATAIRSPGNCAKRFASDPRSSAFISDKWSPTSCTDLFASAVGPAADRTGASDDYQARLSVSCSIQRNIGVPDYLNFLNTSVGKHVAHPRAKLFATRSC
jgi:hypothetical protein